MSLGLLMCLEVVCCVRSGPVWMCLRVSPERYVLKIHFFIEFGPKMIQFKIQFKTKSKIFIQKNIHSKQNPKYSLKKIFIQ